MKSECLTLLRQLREFHPVRDGESYPETYGQVLRYAHALLGMGTLLYVVSRYRTTFARDFAAKPRALASSARAVWLIRTPFFQSLVARLQSHALPQEERRPQKGQFSALCEFLLAFESWLTDAIRPSDCD